jgi:two-component system, NarL family, invasion response regulator UvrY
MSHHLTALALVDDHKLFRKGLRSLIEMVSDNKYHIVFEADNGADLMAKINLATPPDIILLDINMPGMDGFATVEWLNKKCRRTKVLVVSMIDNEDYIIRMLKLGVKGYLSKDVEPDELREALDAVNNKGFYYTDFITGKLIHSLQYGTHDTHPAATSLAGLNDKEKEFLRMVCTELTYSDIAKKMYLSAKTIDGYRNALFDRFNVKSRTGLALFAVRNGLVPL